MNKVLLNLVNEYRAVRKSSLSSEDKLVSIKQMSLMLHNELFDLFKETIGLDTMNDYYNFIKMADNLNKNVYQDRHSVIEENNQLYIVFAGKRKPFLSATEITLIFLNSEDANFQDLFSIFISNDSDLMKFNILF